MSNSIRLRALTQSDLSRTLVWHNQQDIVEMYSGHPFPVNQEMERHWYERILTSNYPDNVFGIEVIESALLIGISILRNIDMLNRCSEAAIYIGDHKYRGKGHSKEALEKTLDLGFNKLGLHRIWLKVRPDNAPAIGLYKSAGFTKEGTFRNALYKNGRFVDLVLFSILSSEYNPEA